MKLISACLVGVQCRFDGGAKDDPYWRRLVERGEAIPICPEQLGGLPTPRTPSEIESGEGKDVLAGRARVVDRDGIDRTGAFLRGAAEALRIARLSGADEAILKDRSPSCGCRKIHRKDEVVPGMGVTAALFESEGIAVCSDEEFHR